MRIWLLAGLSVFLKLSNVVRSYAIASSGSSCPTGKLDIDKDTTSVEAYQYQGCSELTSVTISYKVEWIGSEGFASCGNLETVVFSEGQLTYIGSYAFAWCYALKQLSLPSTVTTVDECGFYECSSLEQVIIPSYTTLLGLNCFSGSYSANTQFEIHMKAYNEPGEGFYLDGTYLTVGSSYAEGPTIKVVVDMSSITRDDMENEIIGNLAFGYVIVDAEYLGSDWCSKITFDLGDMAPYQDKFGIAQTHTEIVLATVVALEDLNLSFTAGNAAPIVTTDSGEEKDGGISPGLCAVIIGFVAVIVAVATLFREVDLQNDQLKDLHGQNIDKMNFCEPEDGSAQDLDDVEAAERHDSEL